MNVLLLTPDAVGGTLLQRLLTIYMQFHEFDRPVINLHELTNGITKYWSQDFNREILGKPNRPNGNRSKGTAWEHHQDLKAIVDLLASVDHYKTARVAPYQHKIRKDTIDQQIPFYNYLNENFFIISCRRKNVFEQALSWSINKITNKLNVYNPGEKISTFINMYNDPINIDTESLIVSLDSYSEYIKWSNDHFNVASYFYYEQHVENIERYILDLPVFSGQKKLISWQDKFDQEFNDWNRCHYLMSDIGTLALDYQGKDEQLLLESSNSTAKEQLSLISQNQPMNLVHHLPSVHKEFFNNNREKYLNARGAIEKMHQLGILTSTMPIKKQTMLEKKHIVKNFNQCVDVYNNWVQHHLDIAQPVDLAELQSQGEIERDFWKPKLALESAGSSVQLIK
jgi:hypothetical protein